MSPTSSPDVSAQLPAHRCRNSTACPVQASIVLPISASCKMRNFPKSGDVYKTKVYVRTVTRGFQGLHSRNSTPCLAFAFILLPVLGSCAFCNLPKRGDLNVPHFIAGRVGTTPRPSLPEFNSLPCSGINRSPDLGKLQNAQLPEIGRCIQDQSLCQDCHQRTPRPAQPEFNTLPRFCIYRSPRLGKLRILQLAKTGRHECPRLHRRTCRHNSRPIVAEIQQPALFRHQSFSRFRQVAKCATSRNREIQINPDSSSGHPRLARSCFSPISPSWEVAHFATCQDGETSKSPTSSPDVSALETQRRALMPPPAQSTHPSLTF